MEFALSLQLLSDFPEWGNQMEAEKLEIVKVGISAITPILVAGIGWLLAGRLKNIEQLQWGNRKLTEKRIQIYEKVSPLLNRLYCYFIYIGDWQAHSPKDKSQLSACLIMRCMSINTF